MVDNNAKERSTCFANNSFVLNGPRIALCNTPDDMARFHQGVWSPLPRQRIDSEIDRARRVGYCSPDTPTNVRRTVRDCGRWTIQQSCSTVEPSTARSAGLMPTEARGNYLPEAPYLRETKTYLNCNSRMHGYIEHAWLSAWYNDECSV